MHSLLRYINNKFELDNMSFSNQIVIETDPQYACDETVTELFYQVGNPNNCIHYTDGSVKSLSDFEPKYNSIILMASKFVFEENEKLIRQQAEIINTPKPFISVKELFAEGLTSQEQLEKIELLKQYNPTIEFSNALYYEVLDRLKKSLLKNSDWTQLPDIQASMSEDKKQEWIEYRAALRILDNIKNPLEARVPKLPTN
jgi:uncharacterized FlgJ-related protein